MKKDMQHDPRDRQTGHENVKMPIVLEKRPGISKSSADTGAQVQNPAHAH